MTRYLQLDWKSSNLYEYSKTDQDGFEKHTNTEGKVSYRKYERKGVTGELLNIGVRDSKIGQQLTLAFKKGEDIIVTQFNLYDQKGQVDNSYPESIITHLGNLKKGEIYTMFPYNLSADDQRKYDEDTEGREVRDKYYDRRAVSFKQNGKKVNSFLTYAEGEKNSIPKLEWKKNRAGDNRPTASSVEAKNEFLLDALYDAKDGHLSYDNNNSGGGSSQKEEAPEPKQEKEQPKKEKTTKKPVEEDDLPF